MQTSKQQEVDETTKLKDLPCSQIGAVKMAVTQSSLQMPHNPSKESDNIYHRTTENPYIYMEAQNPQIVTDHSHAVLPPKIDAWIN